MASITIVEHADRALLTIAEFVTVTFVNQKNGKKELDSRPQCQTNNPHLCLVIFYATQVKQVLRTVSGVMITTTINTIALDGKVGRTTITYILNILRNTCYSFGGKATFRFDPHKIGNKLIWLGTNISTAKIMILGQWSSDAFLVYIRPQVLEWTNNMNHEMISVDSFFDVQINHHTITDTPHTQVNRFNTPFNGPPVVISRLHLNH